MIVDGFADPLLVEQLRNAWYIVPTGVIIGSAILAFVHRTQIENGLEGSKALIGKLIDNEHRRLDT